MIDSRLKKGLGRGLSSLLGDSTKKIETNKISINDLTRNRFQPRKHFDKESLIELTNSIKERGVIQPIVVRPNKSNEDNPRPKPFFKRFSIIMQHFPLYFLVLRTLLQNQNKTYCLYKIYHKLK